MAESYNYYKKEIKEYLESKFSREASVLDVGCGNGTYYELLKGYFKRIDGVEVFKGNIEKYRLREKYSNIYNKDIEDFRYKWYDIVIFGDVIEHLGVEEAKKVIEYANDRCREMIVAVPYCYKQGIVEDNVYEIHKQDDLTNEIMLDRYKELELMYKNEVYGYYRKRRKAEIDNKEGEMI